VDGRPIRCERTPGAAVVLDGQPHHRKGRSDYLLCLPSETSAQPLLVALIEAKAEDKLPSLGLQQGRGRTSRFLIAPGLLDKSGSSVLVSGIGAFSTAAWSECRAEGEN
jgi:hypothetical protein